MNSMDYYEEEQAEIATTFPLLMRKVYAWMAGGLFLTAIVSLLTFKNGNLLYMMATHSAMVWGLLIAEVALVFILTGAINKMSFSTAGLLFVLYCILNGLSLSVIFAIYTHESIASAFFITAGTFGIMSFLGYTTKKDLTGMGKILYMLLIGLVLATIVNLFLKSSGMEVIMSYAGVVIFVGLTAYDTQKIKNMLIVSHNSGANETTNKLALLGSLQLYLDFINLFLYLLRFLGNRRE